MSLCANCNVCEFMPEQPIARMQSTRIMETGLEGEAEPVILVIDECSVKDTIQAIHHAAELVQGKPFVYTPTVRCQIEEGVTTFEQVSMATARCSVWTRQLLEGKLFILSTPRGLKQIGIKDEYALGTIIKSQSLGYVLVIPPVLWMIVSKELYLYVPKVMRVLKELKLI